MVDARWVRALAAALLLTTSACVPLDDLMATIFGRSMRDQNSFDPYENPVPAPENAVPFASANFPAARGELMVGQPEGLEVPPPPFTQADVTLQRDVVMNLVNPVPADAESLARGEELYLRNCAPCHGPDGAGQTGYIIEAGYPLIISLLSEQAVGYPDGYIYGMIRVGRGLMPAYGARISHFDRWNVVNYVRQLQQAAAPAPVEEPPAPGPQ